MQRFRLSRSRPAKDGLTQWRARRMEQAGVPADAAHRLAGQDHLDLHALLELIDRGCPPLLAARITAPLDAPVDER